VVRNLFPYLIYLLEDPVVGVISTCDNMDVFSFFNDGVCCGTKPVHRVVFNVGDGTSDVTLTNLSVTAYSSFFVPVEFEVWTTTAGEPYEVRFWPYYTSGITVLSVSRRELITQLRLLVRL